MHVKQTPGKWAVVCAVALVTAIVPAVASGAASPNASLTPGASDPRVTPATVSTTICRRGYTSTVRNVSTQTKHAIYVAYAIPRSAQRNYVIDHLVPLEVGGANDPTNLWPEPKAEAKAKDVLENQTHVAVCRGAISLADAQARLLVVASPAVTAPATEPQTAPPTEPPPTEVPAAPAPSPQVVHPGAFCAPQGDIGVTTAGTPMVCGPASDGRNRWHAA